MPRAMRICAATGCGEPTTTTRCATHQREYEVRRGTASQRGYDYQFKKASAKAKAKATHCANCGEAFTEANPVTGGHRRSVRDGGSTKDGIVAQCRRCNYGWRKTGL